MWRRPFSRFCWNSECAVNVSLWNKRMKKELATDTGYLRDKGWVMTMAFSEKVGGLSALKALQTYAEKLDKKYQKKAFKYFSDIDMRQC